MRCLPSSVRLDAAARRVGGPHRSTSGAPRTHGCTGSSPGRSAGPARAGRARRPRAAGASRAVPGRRPRILPGLQEALVACDDEPAQPGLEVERDPFERVGGGQHLAGLPPSSVVPRRLVIARSTTVNAPPTITASRPLATTIRPVSPAPISRARGRRLRIGNVRITYGAPCGVARVRFALARADRRLRRAGRGGRGRPRGNAATGRFHPPAIPTAVPGRGQAGLRRVVADDRPDQEGGRAVLGDRRVAAVRVRARARRVGRRRGAERRRAGDLLGVDYDIAEYSYDVLPHALVTGQADIVGAELFVTDDRKKLIDFSTPYYQSGQLFYVLEDSPYQTIDDLNQPDVRFVVRDRHRPARAGEEVRSEGAGATPRCADRLAAPRLPRRRPRRRDDVRRRPR